MKIIKRVLPPEGDMTLATSRAATKYLQETSDGFVVEATYIRRPEKHTLCVSTQVGCVVGCRFCASGLRSEGIVYQRSLTSAEMVEECCNITQEMDFAAHPKKLTLAFMGEGEPFLNFNECVKAFHTLAAMEWPVPMQISVSTSGVRPDLIRRLGEITFPVPLKLLVSLHGPSDDVRSRIIPVSKPISEILSATQAYQEKCGRPVVWNLLAQTWESPNHWRQVLDWTEEAFHDGARVHPLALCERFDLTFTLRGAVFEDLPGWKAAISGSRAQKIANLSNSEMRAAMQRDLDDPTPKVFSKRMQDVFVSAVRLDEHKSLVGKDMVEIGREQGKSPLEAMLDLAIAENLDTQFLIRGFQNGDEESVRGLTTSPYVLTGGSDGGAHVAFLCQVTYSSFLLSHWVREKKALTLEQAVRKLTFDPAVLLGIPNRGLLKEGMAADLTLFDPDKVQAKEKEFVRDLPGGASRLVARADGYRYTVVNGQVLLRDGEPTGACPGRVLRSYEQ